jgi:hypothetical protein
MARSIVRFVPLTLVLLPCALGAQSTTTAAVAGRVLAADGAPVEAAQVTLLQASTGVRYAALTDAEGGFVLRLVGPGGPYTLSLTAFGFAAVSREGIQLRVGETLRVDVEMRTEAIAVEGIRVRLDRDAVFRSSQIGPVTLLDQALVESIPILSRDLTQLAVLSPMVKTSEEGFSVAGQNDRYTALLVDGIAAKDVFGLTAGGIPGGQAGAKLLPLDAVAQYEVLVAPFDVRLSGFTGGVMNAVTRTGTNRWEGSAFGNARGESFTGKLELPGGRTADPSGVSREIFGFSLGGPLVRDVAHVFVSAEIESRSQPPDGLILGRDDPILPRITPSAMDRLLSELDVYGVDGGDPGVYVLRRDLANVFSRVDWRISDRHRLTARHVLSRAEDDTQPNRTAYDAYELSSNAVFRTSTTNTASVQFLSSLDGPWSNELLISLQRASDETSPAVEWPQVEVEVTSDHDPVLVRPVRAGSQLVGQANDLDQTMVELADHLTAAWGDHTVTFGARGALYDIDHLYLPGSAGSYRFLSMQDLADSLPHRYERTILQEGVDPRVRFSVMEVSGFVQDEFRVDDRLTLRYGIRMDVPVVPDRPTDNAEVQRLFGKGTNTVPSRQILFSPRFGFTWQSGGERTTQIRGGAGLFLGRPPFVWLANAYANDGLRTVTLVCDGGRDIEDATAPNRAPPFDPRGPLPDECVQTRPGAYVRTVTLFDEGFQFPQDLKLSLAADREITDRLTASASVIFTRALNQVFLEDLNIGPAVVDPDPDAGYTGGYGNRLHFGVPTATGFAPTRLHPEYGHVLQATNRSDDHAWAVSAELRGELSDHVRFQAGYSFSRSYDRMSLTFTDMISNFGLNGSVGHPNRPDLRPSRFDRPHKVVVALSGTPIPGLRGTEISVLYTGESGLPFSYVYRSDINGDGYPGSGAASDRYNDLVWLPREDELSFFPSEGPGTSILMANALRNDECLSAYAGRMVPRNACRAPWQNRLDLRVSQRFPAGPVDVRIDADVVNVLNLLNGSWGHIREARSSLPLLEADRRVEDSPTGLLEARWGGAVLPIRDAEGNLRPAEPWVNATPDSQWQAQIGLRVSWR